MSTPMALRRRVLALLVAAAPALGLVACGDDGETDVDRTPGVGENVPGPGDEDEGDPDDVVDEGERPGLGGDDSPAVDDDGDMVTGDAED